MEIFEFLGPLLGKIQDPAVLVPTSGFVFLGYLHIVWRREEREDRQKMMEAFNKLVEALNQVKVAIASVTGKAP
jgi:hypothetical protein